MAVQLGVLTRNRRLDSIEVELGTTPVLTMWTGALPANCAAANAGTAIVTITLPSDWMAAASGGTKTYTPTWSVPSATGGGTVVHFRINKTGAGSCEMQGTCGIGTGDLQLDNTNITAGQTVTITGFTLTDGNA